MEAFKFEELEYVRPDFEGAKKVQEEATEQIKSAKSYAEVKEAMKSVEEMECHLQTLVTICNIRNTLDTTDEFYEKEIEYIQNTYPTIVETGRI